MLVTYATDQRPVKRRGVVAVQTPSGHALRAAPGGRTNPPNPEIQLRRYRFGQGARLFANLSQAQKDEWQAAAASADLLNVGRRPWAGNNAGLYGRIHRAATRMGEPVPSTPEAAGQRLAIARVNAVTRLSADVLRLHYELDEQLQDAGLLWSMSSPQEPGSIARPPLWRNTWRLNVADPLGPGSFEIDADAAYATKPGQAVWIITQLLDQATRRDGRELSGPFVL